MNLKVIMQCYCNDIQFHVSALDVVYVPLVSKNQFVVAGITEAYVLHNALSLTRCTSHLYTSPQTTQKLFFQCIHVVSKL